MSKTDASVEIESKGQTHTIVGGDGGPWWVKYSMQAGFMFILILVLWGAYDLFKTKLPTLVEPLGAISETTEAIEGHSEKSTAAQERQATALEKVAEAQKVSAEAAKKQADAIERWVNMQSYRVTTRESIYGPPATTGEP